MKLLKSTILIVILAVCAAFTVQPAKADQFISLLNAGNPAIAGFPGPYGQVTVDLTSTTMATITFVSFTSGTNIYLFGDGSSVAVNVNASSFTLGTISGSNAGTGFTPGPYSDGGSGNVDGLGIFNQTINSFDGFTHSSDTISFTLTNNDVGGWASAANVLINNSDGFDAAAHIFVTPLPAVGKGGPGALATGFAGEGPQGAVPDGGTTAMLLGTALTGLGFARRYLKR